MRIVSGLGQILLFVFLIGTALVAAGLIANHLPWTDPPGALTRLSTYLSTNVAQTADDSLFPELRPRRYAAPPALLFDIARRAAQRLGWEIVSLDAEKKEIQAVVTTNVFRFKDDVTIHIQPAEPNGSALFVRSASRVGKGDLGANIRHVLDLVQAVNATAPASALVPQQVLEKEAKEE